ncbi:MULTISPECIES: restriction endonuclease subunit S [Bacillus]|uniref:Type I restriction modification DNA specificity domain-containing protein n=1 Tax=Bacillus pseudomycoides TaxID=64104 RepID=A0A1Y3M784_9BACI|nr:hypothetical protein BW425_24485 [Bacillus pseudomycoides]
MYQLDKIISPSSHYKLKDIVERVVNPVEVIPEKKYTQIGIRSHGKGIFIKEGVTGKELGNKRVYWIEPNCFIVNIVFAWERAVARTTSNLNGLVASHRFPMYKLDDTKVDLDYFTRLFLTKRGQTLLELASPGGAGRNKTLGQKEFLNSEIILPNIRIQKFISSFLEKLDNKIHLQQVKIDLLKEQKKGYMQKIFSQELRFKDEDEQELPKWELKTLGDVIKVNSGRDYKHLNSGNIPVYGTGGYMLSVDKSLSDEDAIGIGRKGTINQPQKLIAPFWTVDTLFYCTSKKSNDLDFIYTLFQFINWEKYNESTGVPSLSKKIIETIEYAIPCYEEQKKIGAFFKKNDERIFLELEKLTELQNQKQAFMQQMFI